MYKLMANIDGKVRPDSSHPLPRFKSTIPLIRSKSAVLPLQKKLKRQPFLVLYVDENCPLHGSRGKCTCASFVNDENDEMGSSNTLNRSLDFGQQYYDNNNEFVSSSVKPYNNHPPLSNTQRHIVGNNCQFNSSSQNADWIDEENDQLAALLRYRDALKHNLATPSKPGSVFPRMRNGRMGSQWRHVKQTNTYAGSNLMFIDGTVRIDDSIKYPIPRFGYPPLKRPQHKFSASYNDLSNSTTKSFDNLTWSGNDPSKQRPYLSQHSNRFQRQAKDNFPYWQTDSSYKKPRCKPGVTGTYKTWLGLSNAALKI